MAKSSDIENSAQALTLKGSLIDNLPKEDVFMIALANAKRIKNLPFDYYELIAKAVIRSVSTGGNGLQDLVPFIETLDGISKAQARFIANDQNRKIYSEISSFKLKKLGTKQYEWLYTGNGGEGCFPAHQELNGKIFSFGSPPIVDKTTGERGEPAQMMGCFCSKKPIISFD